MLQLQFHIPTALIVMPLAAGVSMLILGALLSRTGVLITTTLTLLVQVGLLTLAGRTLANEPGAQSLLHRLGWIDEYDIAYFVQADAQAVGLVALSTLVVFAATVFAWYAGRDRLASMCGLLWLSAAALNGLFVARDLVLFYVFFELMLVPMLFLVGGWGGLQRVRAALVMFIYTLVGSLVMLVGVIGVGVQAETFDLTQLPIVAQESPGIFSWWMFASFVLAFAVKAPLIPLHGWVPLAYREAPAEIAAVLSGLVSKAAMWGFALVVLPLFAHQMADWDTVLIWLAIATLLYGSIAAFRQSDARGVLAYSSIAQMGLILLGLFVYLGGGIEQALPGAYLQAINHGLISASLFLLVGIVELRGGSSRLDRVTQLAQGRPVLASLVMVAALCALAVPGSSAFAGELMILAGAFQASWVYAAAGGAAIVLAAMYALRLLSALLHNDRDLGTGADLADVHTHTEPDAHTQPQPETGFGGDMRWPELVAVAPLIAALVALSAYPNAALRPLEAGADKQVQGAGIELFTAAEQVEQRGGVR